MFSQCLFAWSCNADVWHISQFPSLHDPKTKQHQDLSRLVFSTTLLTVIFVPDLLSWRYFLLYFSVCDSLGNACLVSSSSQPALLCSLACSERARPDWLGWIRFDHLITCCYWCYHHVKQTSDDISLTSTLAYVLMYFSCSRNQIIANIHT